MGLTNKLELLRKVNINNSECQPIFSYSPLISSLQQQIADGSPKMSSRELQVFRGKEYIVSVARSSRTISKTSWPICRSSLSH